MSQEMQLLGIVLGLAVIAVLLFVIYRQLRSQRQQRQTEQQLLDDMQAQAQKQRDHVTESIRVISSAMQDEQCELAEGCIRLKVLLDHIAPYLHEHEDFCIINEMFEATKHMPILEEWKKLKIKQRFQLTQEREGLELRHKAKILAAASKLSRHQFTQ